MGPDSRTRLRRALPLLVSGGVLAWLLLRFDLGAAFGAVDRRTGLLLGASLAAYGLLSLALEAGALSRLFARERVGFALAARVKAASYLLSVVHITVGLGALAVLLRRRTGLELGRAASGVMLLSALDLGFLVLLGAAGGLLFETRVPAVRGEIVGLLAGAGLAGTLALRLPCSWAPLRRLRSWSFVSLLAELPLGVLVRVGSLRLVFVLSFASLIGVALLAFGVTMPVGDLAIGVLVVSLVSSLPIAVSGLGTGQAAFLYCFREYAPPEVLLASSLALSAGLLATRALIGVGFAREYVREASRSLREAGP